MKPIFIFLLVLLSLNVFGKRNSIYRNIPYVAVNNSAFDQNRNVLDVYSPNIKNKTTEVIVFIHGGKWKMGDKDMFNYVGMNFAEKGKTAVLINYRLSPEVGYEEMAMDCARAIEWVYNQIEYYGGDKSKIYLCGHSSGGHLAALISTNNRFFDSLKINNPIKGCMLIDAFAMDIHDYLQNPNPDAKWMYAIFSKDELKWKDASPAHFVTEDSPKYLIFLGEKTKNAIYHDAKNFETLLEKRCIPSKIYVMKNKKHMKMIGQLLDYRNVVYKRCIEFMNDD
jgi:acetyl esterase/lipase